MAGGELPDYAQELHEQHQAERPLLNRAIDRVPAPVGATVVDVACGDGWYARQWHARVAPQGRVVATDLSAAYLRGGTRRAGTESIAWIQSSAEQLPFASESFDVAWCAHSLVSLPRPLATLREMRRVTRLGGVVAVLENDSLHALYLGWPPEVELEIRRAELRAYQRTPVAGARRYVPRNLGRYFHAAGLRNVERVTLCQDLSGPFAPEVESFLRRYLEQLSARVSETLEPPMRAALARLSDPASPGYLFRGRHAWVTFVECLAIGQVDPRLRGKSRTPSATRSHTFPETAPVCESRSSEKRSARASPGSPD